MLTIPWNVVSGWGVPQIQPCLFMIFDNVNPFQLVSTDAPLQLDPSSTVLHYAQTIFEGMKAYRHDNGTVTIFRPDMNMKRMNRSAKRIALPVSTRLFLFSRQLLSLISEFQWRLTINTYQTTR